MKSVFFSECNLSVYGVDLVFNFKNFVLQFSTGSFVEPAKPIIPQCQYNHHFPAVFLLFVVISKMEITIWSKNRRIFKFLNFKKSVKGKILVTLKKIANLNHDY